MIKLGIFIVLLLIIVWIRNIIVSKPKRKFHLPAGEYFIVTVDLENCEVLSSINKQEEYVPNVMTPLAEITNSRMYDGPRSGAQTPSTYVRLIHNGREFLSGPFSMSREGVLVEFMSRKNTTLYINKHDASNYYFDLKFLEPA